MSAVCTTTASLSSLSLPAARQPAVPPAVRRGAWQLAAGEATSLKASTASVLCIRQGRAWVTRDADVAHASEDIVLAPGESLAVAAGDRLVMEAWDRYGVTYSWDAIDAQPRG